MAIPEDKRRGPKLSVQFSDGLRRARKDADLTQEALAAEAAISIDSVRRAENGKPVSLETARAIGIGLKIRFENLLVSDEPKPSINPRPRKQVISEYHPYYKYYSDGGLVEKLTVNIPAYVEEQFVVYPLAFPNEVTHIQPVADIAVSVKI